MKNGWVVLLVVVGWVGCVKVDVRIGNYVLVCVDGNCVIVVFVVRIVGIWEIVVILIVVVFVIVVLIFVIKCICVGVII